ncbi:MAG TPA: hypothetical protein DCR40_10365 [Prolixibacteraceae bacterium]|nr:hypothetical protein [Prolixibacteraceae bacterium]
METEISLKEFLLIIFGFGYLVNHRSKEIHRVTEKHRNCHLNHISGKTSEHITKRKALKLIKNNGYNGCRWCWPEADAG